MQSLNPFTKKVPESYRPISILYTILSVILGKPWKKITFCINNNLVSHDDIVVLAESVALAETSGRVFDEVEGS